MIRVIESNLPDEVIRKAAEFAKGFKGSKIDLDNHIIVIPFSKDSTEEDLMSEGMLGKWFSDNGFDIEFTRGDLEYTTQDKFNSRSMNRTRGQKAYLRDRLIGTITW